MITTHNLGNKTFAHKDFDFEKLPKLVRDNIPKIILEKEGIIAKTLVLSDEEFEISLKKKLVEESLEALNTENLEDLSMEIADVYQVLDTLLDLKKIKKENIIELQNQKKTEKWWV